MKHVFLFLIRTYQLCISPFLGPCCRFVPSCSEYALEAIKIYGIWKGVWLICKRVIKCGPWHSGGCDFVPPKESSKPSQAESLSMADD